MANHYMRLTSAGVSMPSAMFSVRVDTTSFKTKPDKDADAGPISVRISQAPFREYSATAIARLLAQGCTICPADFADGKRSPDNWRAQQLWLVDIDNDEDALVRCGHGLREVDAVERAEAMGLPLLMAYQSFSGTSQANVARAADGDVSAERYRIVFAKRELVTDREEAEAFGAMLLHAYPEADSTTVQLNRMFYGTDKEVDLCLRLMI